MVCPLETLHLHSIGTCKTLGSVWNAQCWARRSIPCIIMKYSSGGIFSSTKLSRSSSSAWCIGWSPWWDAVANVFTMVRACSNARVRLADRFEFESSSCWIKVVELFGCSESLIGLSCDLDARWRISDGEEGPDPIRGPCPLSWSPFLKGRASEVLLGC